MASTGCPSGELQTRLRLGQFEEALRSAAEYQEIFGKENYFLELMDHGLDIERKVRDGLVEIGKKLGIPAVVTNDSHYTRESDATRTTCCSVSRPASPWPMRTGSASTAAATTSSPPREMYATDTSDVWQEGLPEQPAPDRRPGGHHRHVRVREPHAAVPDPRGLRAEEELFRAEVWKGMDRRYPDSNT